MMEHIVDLIPGYTLGSLDEDELVQVARHLPHCAACRAELDSYLKTVDQLAFLVPERIPAPELKEKILNLAGAAPTARPVPLAAPRTQTHAGAPGGASPGRAAGFLRGLFAQPLAGVITAAALLLLVVLGISNLNLRQQVNGLQAELAKPQNMRVIYMKGTDSAPETHGYLMVFTNENYGTLVVENAPELPKGYQYQLWLIRDGKRTSGGVFSVGNDGYGVLQVNTDQPLESFPAFGVTIEPEGGSPGPTGDRVLGGSL